MTDRPSPAPLASSLPPPTLAAALRLHWPLYLMEASELALFMLSACAFTIWLFYPASPLAHAIPNDWARRAVMGIAMGLTAVLIIHSPMGKHSGAHFNPAITLTYLRLAKIGGPDALFYVIFQFAGGAAGVGLAALIFGAPLAAPSVQYAVTVPGRWGTAAAFAAEFFMAILLMSVVLWTSNRPALAARTSYFVGGLITLYILFLAPVSGFSINPARTVASALFAHVWTAAWIYFAAPLLGMFAAAEVYLRSEGADGILCAKLHPDPAYPCPFRCHFPGHLHKSAVYAEK